ncbi:MAG TPA: cellulose synthase family protein [Anaerolineales bacterium]|nr:cellulose synthase family protein [Anaerolineales bacterium]
MLVIGYISGSLYVLCMLVMSLYGLNAMITAILFVLARRRPDREQTPPEPKEWPKVTVQLPVFNERYMLERLLGAVTRLDYPADRLQIQVLDDSTDDTALLSARLVEEYRAGGVNIECVFRIERGGYKAGALAKGLETASGELLAIFDADFIPAPDWLKRTVPQFQDPELGCLQTRWGHTNREYNLLTRAQALAMDAHFIVEQTARSRNHLFMNFNGSAGIWRRSCIEDTGGWQTNTLTEDFDLSFRAQLQGWKIRFLPEVIVPAELPASVEAFKKQQFRWAKGSIQVTRKIVGHLFRRPDIPPYKRISGLLQLTAYIVHPLMIIMLFLTLPVGLLAPRFFSIFPISILATFGPPMLYAMAGAKETPSLAGRLKILPVITIIGFGISLNSAIAILEALIGKGGTFVRTPKLNLTNKPNSTRQIDRAYLQPISPIVWGEIGLGLYSLLTIALLEPGLGWAIIPWMGVYWLGYFYIASLNLYQHWQAQTSRSSFAINEHAQN